MSDVEVPAAVESALKDRAMNEAPVGITIADADRDDVPLIYCNAAFERLTGYPASEAIGRNCRFLQGEDTDPDAVAAMRSAIDSGEPVTVEVKNYRRDGTAFWNEVTIAPIRDEEGQITHYVGFQDDVTQRKEAQLSLAAERERLDRVLDRINGLLIDVTTLLMQGVERAETERALIDLIADTEPYVAAWVGEPDLAGDRLRTSTAAGVDDPGALETPFDADSPIAEAYRDRTVRVIDDLVSVGLDGLSLAAQSLAAIPLDYGETVYGVLVVLSADPSALDDRERVVLGALGRTIATAINAAESRRVLTADDLVELTVSIDDATFFPVTLAAHCGGQLEHRGTVSAADGALRLFFDVKGDLEALGDGSLPEGAIEAISIVGSDGPLEVDVGSSSLLSALAERGAQLQSLTADAEAAALELVVGADTGGRPILEILESRYDGVELLTYRERERPPTTEGEFVSDVEGRLTDRQAAALRSAYYGGYYDRSRSTTGDELAEAMGVSRSTFHQHLRAGERKLIEAVFDR